MISSDNNDGDGEGGGITGKGAEALGKGFATGLATGFASEGDGDGVGGAPTLAPGKMCRIKFCHRSSNSAVAIVSPNIPASKF